MRQYTGNCGFDATIEEMASMAREFGEKMRQMGPDLGSFWFDHAGRNSREDNPHLYFFPPTNCFEAEDGSLTFEFALAGYSESDVSIAFQGDFLLLSAKAEDSADRGRGEWGHWHHGFRLRNIEKQKYRVPADEYIQDSARAVFKNGVLTVSIPAKEAPQSVKIEIVKEGN